MQPLHQRGCQAGPDQRKWETNPAMEIPGNVSVIPKGDPKNPLVKNGGEVFGDGGNQPAAQQ